MERLQAALAAIDAATEGADESKLLIKAKCRGLMRGYHARWANEQWGVDGVEELLTAPIYNPNTDTNSTSRTFRLGGKLDAICTAPDGRRFVLDHKTTSDEIGDGSAYWKQLRIESQISQYMLLLALNGRPVDGAMWDVVKKPGISPRNLSKASLKASLVYRTYCGDDISREDALLLEATGRETYAMYEARLAMDCIDRHDRYFARKIIPRSIEDLSRYAAEVWDHAKDILTTRQTGRNTRNPKACMAYKSPCVYMDLCIGDDAPDSRRWKRNENVHVELPDLEGDGRDILTNSRIGTYLTCKQMHHYKYDLGLARPGIDEQEALYFGTLWHHAQEAWWKAQQEKTYDDSSSREETNALAI